MDFDKNKVYTALNADELKVGSKVILADDLEELKVNVECNRNSFILKDIRAESASARFYDGVYAWYLAYLVEEKKLKWTDLKVGDVVTRDTFIAMVLMIDKDIDTDRHICVSNNGWLSNSELEDWQKAED